MDDQCQKNTGMALPNGNNPRLEIPLFKLPKQNPECSEPSSASKKPPNLEDVFLNENCTCKKDFCSFSDFYIYI